MEKYYHFISLGYFCSVALELERIGLRSTSSPFDWCISNFEGVIEAIENKFDDFLNYDLLFQSDNARQIYFNTKYRIWFFHDFDKYLALDCQLQKVKQKYDRRIKRFYEDISQPTLFIRYISDEILDNYGRSIELDYIEKNYEKILSLLKSFNKNNDIIFLSNSGVDSNIIKIYHVEKDENDGVARKPLEKNGELNDLLMNLEFEKREKNIETYNIKYKKNSNICNKLRKKLISFVRRTFLSEYVHEKTIPMKNG